jgi:hypothetical protein
VIAGAQKSGTTTLHQLLGEHPQIFMTQRKEVHYFDWHWDEGLTWYSRHFAPGPEHVHLGESTPTYMYHAESRERMYRTLPELRVVVILRNPTERAYSHYWHSRRKGFETVTTFEEAIRCERRRTATHHIRRRGHFSYIGRGHYIGQLEDLEAAFGRRRLHVMLFEDLINDRESALAGVLSFLGVRSERRSMIMFHRASMRRSLATLGPSTDEPQPFDEIDTGVVPVIRAQTYPPMAADTRARLIDHYRPYNDRLSRWLCRDLCAWNGASA